MKKFFPYCFFTLLVLYAYHLLVTAWVSDDAMITMKVVLNFANGYGAVYNVGERVQAYTHPLWFFLLSIVYFISGDFRLSPYYLSIFTSLLVFILFLRSYRNNFIALLVGSATFICSKSYIDYSTSGLEAPLAHLLILYLFIKGTKIEDSIADCTKSAVKSDKTKEQTCKNLKNLYLISSLIFITRQDLIILIIPYVLYLTLKLKPSKKSFIKSFIIGTLPASLWEAFSIYYYGFPFPNTYYAKLHSGAPLINYLERGIEYIASLFLFDPFAAFMLIFCILYKINKKSSSQAISFGILLYTLYIIYVGGDFMAGRFFTPLIFFGVLKLKDLKFKNLKNEAIFCIIVIISASLNALLKKPGFLFVDGWYYTICDERMNYRKFRNLKNAIREFHDYKRPQKWNFTGYVESITMDGASALPIISAGPNKYVIDLYGLSSSLIARLPYNGLGEFRVGHNLRILPSGLKESIDSGENVIQNKEIHDYYDHIKRVISGKLNSKERFKSIYYLNFVKKKLPKEILKEKDY